MFPCSNTDAYKESLNCVKEIINIITSSYESSYLNNPKTKKRVPEVKSDKKIKSHIKEPSFKLVNLTEVFKNSRNLENDFYQLSFSLENIRNFKVFVFEFFPSVDEFNSLDRDNRVSVIFRVNLYDLIALLDFVLKLKYFRKKILSVCKIGSVDSNTFEAIQSFSGYLFFKSWNYSPQIKAFNDLLQFISIEATDFPTKKNYIQKFILSNSRAHFQINYSNKKIDEKSEIETNPGDISSCLKPEDVPFIEAHETSDLISSYQRYQDYPQMDIEKDELIDIQKKFQSNDFDNFKVPISCNQFLSFTAMKDASSRNNEEANYDLTQCGTKIFNKSSQIIKAIKSDDLDRYKHILAQKTGEFCKPGLLDLTNKASFNKTVDFDKKFIDFVPIQNGLQIKPSINNENRLKSQSNSNDSKIESQHFEAEHRKAQKRRNFMKIGLNKQQKLKGSLHAGFLQTHFKKD